MVVVKPANIIAIFVLVVIGASLVSPMGDVIFGALNGTGNASITWNVSGAPAALLGLLTLFFVIIVVLATVRKIKS